MAAGVRSLSMHVSEIWRYPVKSMVGESVPTGALDELGIAGDRWWATRDLDKGGIKGAKKLGGLMRCRAAAIGATGGDVSITLPNGSSVLTTDPDVHDRVSAAIGAHVRLERLRPASDLDHYRPGAPDSGDMVTEIRAIMGREGDEPLPDFSIFPPAVFEFTSPPGTYYDAFPLMIMSTSSLRSLAAALPDSVIDVRRFRPSFVIDTGDAPGHPELGWAVGTRYQVGGAVIEIQAPCPRCVMPTREIAATIPADRAILRYIVRELGQNLGTYASVVQPGPFAVGDPLTLLP